MAIQINGHTISTVVTSSIMGHSGGGMFPLTLLPSYRRLMRVIEETEAANLTKSSTAFKNIGNFILGDPRTWKYIQRIGDNGLLNAYGLTNDGVNANAPAIASAQERGFNVIPTFYPQFIKGRPEAIKDTLFACGVYNNFLENFWVIEFNFSCPNSQEKIQENMEDAVALVRAVKQIFPWLCVIAKISYVHPHRFAQELINAGADIIHAINTIPYDMVYQSVYDHSPLADVGGGGVSGGPAKDLAMAYNSGLKKVSNAPMIMGCGITSMYDAEQYLKEVGADVISICTVARLNPKEAEKIINNFS